MKVARRTSVNLRSVIENCLEICWLLWSRAWTSFKLCTDRIPTPMPTVLLSKLTKIFLSDERKISCLNLALGSILVASSYYQNRPTLSMNS